MNLRMPIDESLAFTVQLELRPALTRLEGANWRAELLKAWYASDDTDMWQFARKWDRGVTMVCSTLCQAGALGAARRTRTRTRCVSIPGTAGSLRSCTGWRRNGRWTRRRSTGGTLRRTAP